MANALICCGGTGAHVALAFMRLHALGDALGFFRSQANDRTLQLPTLYLVDQDHGDGDAKKGKTAWQMVREVVDAHPSRHRWGQGPGTQAPPRLREITPLPVGTKKDWFYAPNDRLGRRFANSPYLGLLASPEQREINFSLGMMGSPAVGSLLFRLKSHDMDGEFNRDRDFSQLLEETGRVAVVGSGVGGTGAAVGPTLAQTLAEEGSGIDVMAVMVLNWFKFTLDGVDGETRRLAQRRNRVMAENANSAFQYYGQRLSRTVATVPVGLPEGAAVERSYTSDTQQPLCESFAHGVAALCCMSHFVNQNPCSPGLYQMGAEDPARLSGGNAVPGGTLQGLAEQATALVKILRVFVEVLQASQHGGGIAPAICQKVAEAGKNNPRQIGEALKKLLDGYEDHLRWLREVCGIEARLPDGEWTFERHVRQRLRNSPLPSNIRNEPDKAASGLFCWTAEWIREDSGRQPGSGAVNGGYWPPLRADGLAVAAAGAGVLARVSDANVEGVLEGFVDPGSVSENGWPDPIAAVSYFEYAIKKGDVKAKRQLEILLAGMVDGQLELKPVPHSASAPSVSLETLLEEYRKSSHSELAKYALIHHHQASKQELVLGFNSPRTLFCAAPGVDDAVWSELRGKLAGGDAGDWKAAPWRNGDTVGKIRAWIEACLKLFSVANPPAWTAIFEGLQPKPSYGAGDKLQLNWDNEIIDVFLPTKTLSKFQLGSEIPVIDEESFRHHDELEALKDEAGKVLFERVEFEVPDREEPVRGIWQEHLERLREQGKIVAFGPSDSGNEVHLCVLSDEHRHQAVKLSNTRLLARETIRVQGCTPMRQKPILGGRESILYPHLPLRSDYIGLVNTFTGESLLSTLKEGRAEQQHIDALKPREERRQGGQVAIWTLPVKGRHDKLSITLPVLDPEKDDLHQAHWMIWPRFRSTKEPYWRTYYVYERCTDPRLHVDALWLDPDGKITRRTRSDADATDRVSYPVGFDADQHTHVGGPPVAFSARDAISNRELGVYVFSLDPLPASSARIQVGIDFGTSHTVAAIKVDGGNSEPVELAPELDPDNKEKALSMHVCEDKEHVDAPQGLLSQAVWLPNYAYARKEKESAGMLPSELLTISPSSQAIIGIEHWQPMQDFVIPPVRLARQDLAEHVVADFKWNASPPYRGHEPALRERYLGMVVEFVMAYVAQRYGQPSETVDFTFTYPLRTSDQDVESLQETLRKVMKTGSKNLGSELQLINDVGIFDESRAAKGGTNKFGEVCLVGDLGGGTLDLFISAFQSPEHRFEDVADSIRLGGNVLLRKLSANATRFLPRNPSWKNLDAAREAHLRAWMRGPGSRRLFGNVAGQEPSLEGLRLRGFAQPADANRARELINRYFRLLVEYMARSLVAYLAEHWYPKVEEKADKDRLNILVYLRGNGWRLWHRTDQYDVVQRDIARQVKARVRSLWALLGAEIGAAPGDLQWTDNPTDAAQQHPKLAPILEVVGESQSHDEVKESWFAYTLADLEVLGAGTRRQVAWHTRVPFQTDDRKAQVQLNGVSPPLPLSDPELKTHDQIDDLDIGQRRINEKIEKKGIRGNLYQRRNRVFL